MIFPLPFLIVIILICLLSFFVVSFATGEFAFYCSSSGPDFDCFCFPDFPVFGLLTSTFSFMISFLLLALGLFSSSFSSFLKYFL